MKFKILMILLIAVFTPVMLRAMDADIISTSGATLVNDASEDMVLLSSFALIDYSQSVTMFFKSTGYQEMNPVLGPRPSRQDLFWFGTIGLSVSYLITEIVPDTWRQIVIDSIVASERQNIEDNRMLYQGWNTEGPPLRGRGIDGLPVIISVRF